MAHSLWAHKHHIPSFNLHDAVAPNGICVAPLAILARGRHDERPLDDTDAYSVYLRFTYVAPSCQAAVYDQRLFSALLGSGGEVVTGRHVTKCFCEFTPCLPMGRC
jgi:hypothetical protein